MMDLFRRSSSFDPGAEQIYIYSAYVVYLYNIPDLCYNVHEKCKKKSQVGKSERPIFM